MLEGLSFVEVGPVRLCVRDAGQGPAVVLLHGTSANLGVWDSVVDLLGDQVRTVAVDQRGHGRSDRPPAGYDARHYGEDVAGLIRSLELGPAVVVGHSLGARNAVVVAARHPELVAGVVAVDYTPFVEPDVLDDLEVRVAAGDRTFASHGDVVEYLRSRYPLISEDAVERRATYGYQAHEDGYRPLASPEALWQTVAGLRADFDDDVARVGVPVTLVRGALSRIVSNAALARTRSLRPDFRSIELPGVDHYVPEERPDVIAAETRALLDDIQRSVRTSRGASNTTSTTRRSHECL